MGTGVQYSEDEEVLLCRAWLHISTDASKGTGQKQRSFWFRVKENMEELAEQKKIKINQRPESALQARYGDISRDVGKFVGAYAQVCTHAQHGIIKMYIYSLQATLIENSGWTPEMYEDSAQEIYQSQMWNKRETRFKRIACWKVLKDSVKFQMSLADNVTYIFRNVSAMNYTHPTVLLEHTEEKDYEKEEEERVNRLRFCLLFEVFISCI